MTEHAQAARPGGGIDRVTTTKVSKRFGHHRALAGVNIELRAGSMCALLGPNGAGKTTLLGILSTLVRPTGGEVAYHAGANVRKPDNKLRADIGVLAHAALIYGELTAIENLQFFAGLYGVSDVERRCTELLDLVGLDERARDRPTRTYSRGMTQRVALARALLGRPSLLLLDEPFTGLDRGGSIALGKSLAAAKAGGAIVVVVTHDLEAIAGLTDHVVVLRRGAVADEERREVDAGYDYADLKAIYHRYTE